MQIPRNRLFSWLWAKAYVSCCGSLLFAKSEDSQDIPPPPLALEYAQTLPGLQWATLWYNLVTAYDTNFSLYLQYQLGSPT